MEAAFALLLPLVAGYVYTQGHWGLKYALAREDGNRLYFTAALYGTLLFLCSAVLLIAAYAFLKQFPWFVACHKWLIALISPLLKEPEKASSQFAFIVVCLGSIGLGSFAPRILNRCLYTNIYEAASKGASRDQLDLLLIQAVVEQRTILVTIDSGKVYVGMVLMTPDPHADRRVVALLPLMSGYRNETGKAVFTTFYDNVYKDLDPAQSENFKLLLPIDKVASLSFFDVAIYARFNTPEATPGRHAPLTPDAAASSEPA